MLGICIYALTVVTRVRVRARGRGLGLGIGFFMCVHRLAVITYGVGQ